MTSQRLTRRYFDAEASESIFVDQGTCHFCELSGPERAEVRRSPPLLDGEAPEVALVCLECLDTGRYRFAQYVAGDAAVSDQAARDELSRTPPFRSWQRPEWQVHCGDFMTFIGTWRHEDFVSHSPDGNAEALYLAISDAPVEYAREFGPSPEDYAECTFYAFRCAHCQALRGTVDCP